MSAPAEASRIARIAPLAAALLACAFVLWATRSELVVSREPLNDFALHIPLTERLADAMRNGENPFDCWVSEWTLGHPVPRTYQPLGPLAVASAHVVLDPVLHADVATLLLIAHWFLLAAFPLCVFAGARLMGLSRPQAAGAAVVAPLLSTDLLFGIDYSSYVWRGSGLFTQEWAQALLPIALGLGTRFLRRRGSLAPAALVLALTFAAHFVYGLMGALTLALFAVIPAHGDGDNDDAPRAGTRALRLAMLGATTFALSAWLLVPLVLDRPFVNHSRWESPFKWDSYGLPKLATMLATGDLLDHARFPAITLLALAGTGLFVARVVMRRAGDGERLALAGTALWLILACGRPAWDGLYDLLGMGDVPLHRLIGGAHLFLILLAGAGLAALVALPPQLFERVSLTWRHAPAVAAAFGVLCGLLAIAPAVSERLTWLKVSESWGRETIALTDAERGDIASAVALCKQRGGRAFAGSAGGWGKDFGIKWTSFYTFLSWAHVPQVSFLYHAMALTSDVMVRFDESSEAHWRLFGVRTAVAPPDHDFPSFTRETARFGRFVVHAYDTAGGGMFDVVDVVQSVRCDRGSFYDVVDAWLWSEGPAQRRHLALDLDGRYPEAGFEDRPADERLPPGPDAMPGRVLSEDRKGETYGAIVSIDASHAWVMLKMTWHPGWQATVDRVPAPTSHVTPGFVAVRVPRGLHGVELRYVPGRLKNALLWIAPLLLGATILAGRARLLARAEDALAPRVQRLFERLVASPPGREIAGALLLACVAALPLLQPGLGSGHDAVAYPPRVIEMHENLRHGILLPRWAPDLSEGMGQPFFLFTPPLPGWLWEAGYLATGDIARALALPTFLLLVLGTIAMRRAAREIVASESASWVAAAAFATAPYVLTDLHVRAAYAESAALFLAPVALLGLLRHARDRGAGSLVLAALGTALVGLSHHASLLLLAPLLLVICALNGATTRSLRLALVEAGAVSLGVLAAACAWMPGLLESGLVHLERAREGYFHWSVHAVEPWQLVWSPWGYGLSQAGTDDGMSFALGPLLLILAVLAGACAADASRKRHDERGLAVTAVLLLGALLGAVMMTPLSAIAWETLPLLPSVQFPWRLAGPVTLLLALLAGLACEGLIARAPRVVARVLPLALIAVLAAFAWPHAHPGQRTRPDPAALTPAEIARRGLLTTSVEELEPRTVEERAAWSPEDVTVAEGVAAMSATRLTPERWRLAGRAASDCVLVLQLHDFAGWSVEGEGATKLAPEPVTGRMRVAVEAGERDVQVVLHRTRVQKAGIAVSLVAAAGILALGVAGGFATGRRVSLPP